MGSTFSSGDAAGVAWKRVQSSLPVTVVLCCALKSETAAARTKTRRRWWSGSGRAHQAATAAGRFRRAFAAAVSQQRVFQRVARFVGDQFLVLPVADVFSSGPPRSGTESYLQYRRRVAETRKREIARRALRCGLLNRSQRPCSWDENALEKWFRNLSERSRRKLLRDPGRFIAFLSIRS